MVPPEMVTHEHHVTEPLKPAAAEAAAETHRHRSAYERVKDAVTGGGSKEEL